MKHKILSLLLALALSVACLSACGQETEKSGEHESSSSSKVESQSSSQSEATSSEVVELEEKTIQLWLLGPGKQKDSDKVWELFNEKLQEYVPNTTVEFTIIPSGDYKEKFTQMLAAGEAVDLAWVGYITANFPQRISDGEFMEMDALLEEYGQGIIDSIGQDVIDLNRGMDGHVYYLISWQGLVQNRRAYFVPTEYVELAGSGWLEETQEAITTWYSNPYTNENFQKVFDQFDILLSKAKEADKIYGGANATYFMAYNYRFNLYGEGNTRYVGIEKDSDGFKVIDAIQSDAFRTVAKNMAEYYQKGYILPDVLSMKSSQYEFVKDGVYNDTTTIVKVSNYLTDSVVEQETAKAGVDVTAIPIEDVAWLGKGDATGMAIPYCADEPERAMMVLNALYAEPELYQLLIYGQEGVHYTDNGDGTITTPYGSSPTADSDYGLTKWTIGTCMNSLVTQADSKGYYDDLKKAEATAKINPFLGFSFDSSAVQDECAAVLAVDNEYFNTVTMGAAGADWEATLDKWIAERKAAGVEEIVKEYQRQVDEYVKNNNITSW